MPWNSMELGSIVKFHGIPWNYISGQIPWNSMELAVLLLMCYGIPWNHRCCSNVVQKVPWISGENFINFFLSQNVSMSIEERFWMIFWYIMRNAGNAYGMMNILMINHKSAKETYIKIKDAYYFKETNSSSKIEYNFHQNLKTQIPRNFIQI